MPSTLFMPDLVKSHDIFVIIPAYNEATIIQSVLQELQVHSYSLVVIDDGSSASLYTQLKKMPVYFLRHRVNLGQGAALQTGIEFALSKQAKYIITFDADGQHKASDIDLLVEILVNGKFDIVLGSRFMGNSVHNMSASRSFLLQLARYLNYFFTGLLLTDAHNGLRAMNRIAAGAMQIRENRMAHATEILSQIKKKGLRYFEAPVHVFYTPYSRQKGQDIWDSFRVFFDILLHKIFG